MSIHLLSEEVASQIAAGEVIERPASVVKELLENAIDAQASQVIVKVGQAGRRLVEVADDGQGIPFDEMRMAVMRHATSKLSKAEDLFSITTLGFRGEALASIGSVSRMTLVSRTGGAELGGRLRVEGGSLGEVEPTGAPTGTSVRVEDLFYNVPARLQFLKKDTTERRHIDSLVTRYALAYPQTRIQLWQDDRPALLTSGNNDRREVIASLYGVDTARQMLEVLAKQSDIQITGFVSPISITRANRREISFYVNGRPVQDIGLATAVIQAYHTLLMVGRYPMAILFLDLPAEMVDVNVHPTKAEVKFREGDTIFRFVQNSVRRALLAHTPIPQITSSPYLEQPQWDERDLKGQAWNQTAVGVGAGAEIDSEKPADSANSQVALDSAQTHIPLLRLVGQVASAYLVAEGPDGLYLVDQHAAHERVLFEKMMEQAHQQGSPASQSRIPAQELLQSVTVSLQPASARLLSEQLPVLSGLGFRVEEFGRDTYLVRAVPAVLAGLDPAAALRVLVEDFEEDEAPLQKELEARLIARVCKRAAVKAGQVLSAEEQKALLTDLEKCSSPRTCPHGRPTMIHLSVDLLERQFGRRGAR
ncbi:MAG: DNA mismatch repair endonuclease MutL [Anaerolineales bacterium]